MYPSGLWRGFWEQKGWGRQPMADFYLRFRGGAVEGSGVDVIGKFVVSGECDPATGRVRFAKQYVGRHTVVYDGTPDGEGSILGTWRIGDVWTGSFALQPVSGPVGELPIQEIGK